VPGVPDVALDPQRGGSTIRSCTASSATSTSRTLGSSSDRARSPPDELELSEMEHPPLRILAVAALALAGCGSGGGSARPLALTAPAARTAPPSAPAAKPAPAPRRPSAAPRPSASSALVNHGPRTARRVALTFDADMTRGMLLRLRAGRVRSWYDARIVRELRATRTPATVFLTGLWTQTYPAVVRSLAADPLFELENHSIDHAAFGSPCFGLPTVPSAPAKREEVAGAAAAITATAGRRPRYFRFPGGCHSEADARLVAAEGETPVGWDVVSGDPFQPAAAAVVRAVLGGVRPGSIVVMHLVGAPNAPATFTALQTVIPALQARGYRFVTLRELLRGGGG